jgi:hypothetical protein
MSFNRKASHLTQYGISGRAKCGDVVDKVMVKSGDGTLLVILITAGKIIKA